jgi:hypothetical protein
MWQAEQFGQHHARLAEAGVVGLQAGQDQIVLFALDGGGESAGRCEAFRLCEAVVFNKNAAIGALGQGSPSGNDQRISGGWPESPGFDQ